MRQLSPLLRASNLSLRLPLPRPALSAPPSLVYQIHRFTTTAPRPRYQLPTRKDQVIMPTEMTTLKGEPFDRASLESLVKACDTQILRPRESY